MTRLVATARRFTDDGLAFGGIALIGLGLGQFHPGLALIAWGVGLLGLVRFGS